MRITSKGQVTIPIDVREEAGLLPDAEVNLEFDGLFVRIVRVEPANGRVGDLESLHICRGGVT